MMKQAIILAAGEGQRLRPFTVSRPKVMLSVAGKPVIRFVIEALAECGIRDIVIVAGYHKEQVFDGLGDGETLGVDISYAVQDRQLGTAHALKQAAALAADEFLVLPGDHIIDAETIRDFTSLPPWALLLKRVPESKTVRCGVVSTENGLVKAIVEKPREPCDAPVSTGIFSLTRDVFDRISSDNDLPAVVNRMIADGIEIAAVETPGPWLDAVYPWDLLALNGFALRKLTPSTDGMVETGVSLRDAVNIGAGSVVCSGCYLAGPVLVGRGCDLGPNSVIGPDVTIGDNVCVGPLSIIERSVIGDDVCIGPGAVVQDSIIGSGCRIGPCFKAASEDTEIRLAGEFHALNSGVIMGDNCRIGSGVVVESGTIVGNNCSVRALRVVSGILNDSSQVV